MSRKACMRMQARCFLQGQLCIYLYYYVYIYVYIYMSRVHIYIYIWVGFIYIYIYKYICVHCWIHVNVHSRLIKVSKYQPCMPINWTLYVHFQRIRFLDMYLFHLDIEVWILSSFSMHKWNSAISVFKAEADSAPWPQWSVRGRRQPPNKQDRF